MRFPGIVKLVFFAVVADAFVGVFVYAFWRWIDKTQTAWLAQGDHRSLVQTGLALVTLVGSALLLRWLIYRSSSWQPSFLLVLLATALTPLLGGLLLWLAASNARERAAARSVSSPTPLGARYTGPGRR